MPSFTMELWRVIDMKPDTIPEDTWLGLNEYPLHESVKREDLNKLIKDHFMYQEIGHETVEQFTFSLKRKMNEIMPTYNQLYKSIQHTYNPLETVNIRTESEGEESQTSEGETASNTKSDIDAHSENLTSNYPQTMQTGGMNFASAGGEGKSKTETTADVAESSEAKSSADRRATSTTKGYQGVPAQLIMAERAAIINVALLIIGELDSLFMQVWGTSDEYSATKGFYHG